MSASIPRCRDCQFWTEDHDAFSEELHRCKGYPSQMTNEALYTPPDWGCAGHSDLVDSPDEYDAGANA